MIVAPGRPIFLDRDGTLIVEMHYLKDPDLVRLESGVVEGLRKLSQGGFSLIVLSNQSGIGRGLLTERDARRVNDRLDGLLRSEGIEILAWYFCPHAPDVDCECRKPNAGMARAASIDHGVELSGSFVVGDKRSDVELADAIGGTGILVTTGHGIDYATWAMNNRRPIFASLTSAADYILESTGGAVGAI